MWRKTVVNCCATAAKVSAIYSHYLIKPVCLFTFSLSHTHTNMFIRLTRLRARFERFGNYMPFNWQQEPTRASYFMISSRKRRQNFRFVLSYFMCIFRCAKEPAMCGLNLVSNQTQTQSQTETSKDKQADFYCANKLLLFTAEFYSIVNSICLMLFFSCHFFYSILFL